MMLCKGSFIKNNKSIEDVDQNENFKTNDASDDDHCIKNLKICGST